MKAHIKYKKTLQEIKQIVEDEIKSYRCLGEPLHPYNTAIPKYLWEIWYKIEGKEMPKDIDNKFTINIISKGDNNV